MRSVSYAPSVCWFFFWVLMSSPMLAAESSATCDLVVIPPESGSIITMNPLQPRVDALAVADGRIVALGSVEEIHQRCSRAPQITPKSGSMTVLPGFIDSHSHFLPYGLAKSPAWIDVSSANPFFVDPLSYQPVLSQEQLKRRIQSSRQYEKLPVLLGAGFDPSRTISGDNPDLAFMNSISDKKPIFVWDASMHSANINQPMIDLILGRNICPTKDSSTEDSSADPATPQAKCLAQLKDCTDVADRFKEAFCDGLLEETMMQKFLGLFSAPSSKDSKSRAVDEADHRPVDFLSDSLEDGLKIAGETYAQKGFTTATDIAIGGILDAYLQQDGSLPLDMVVSTTTPDNQKKVVAAAVDSPWLYSGPIKTWADGSIQGRTGFVGEALLGQPISHGEMNADNYVLAQFIEEAFQNGFPVAVHTNGDAAIDVTLTLLEAAMIRYPEARSLRNVFIHAPMVDHRALERMAAINAMPSFLIQHPFYWGQPICHSILGPERTANLYNPVDLAVSIVPHVAFHSDAFVTPPDPLRMVWAGTKRQVQDVQNLQGKGPGYSPLCPEILAPGQRVTIERALQAITFDAAYQFSLEHEKGSLEVGKLADLVFLSADPLLMEEDPDDLLRINVLGTLQRGRCHNGSGALQCPTSVGGR